jgi:CelD/BcsL family acetyltransferase involved in cellulose biosynthesis
VRQDPITIDPVRVELRRGLPEPIDDAAALADPGHAFLRRAWFEAAVDDGVHTLIARRGDGSLIAALPTCETGLLLGRIRAVPGSYWPYRSFSVAADVEDAELGVLLAHDIARRALGRVWRLGPVYEDDPTAARLLRVARTSGWTPLCRRLATSFLLDIDAVQTEGKWPRGSTLRKNRFHEKHLAAHGKLEWRFVSGGDWSREIFDALAKIELGSWVAKETSGKDAKFMAAHNRIFWENAARDPVLAEMMSAAILYVGGEPAAFSFDLDVGSVKHAIANSYDERFAKHSPGKLLYYRNLVRAMERGIRLVDWGAGDGGYKSTIGAAPGPAIIDLLFVRGGALAALIRPFWERPDRG